MRFGTGHLASCRTRYFNQEVDFFSLNHRVLWCELVSWEFCLTALCFQILLQFSQSNESKFHPLTQFLSNRSQFVLVDGCRSKLVNLVSGVPQGSVLGQLLFLLYTSELFSILENKLIGYADDSLHFDGCCAIPRSLSYGSWVPEPWPRQSECVVRPMGDEIECE